MRYIISENISFLPLKEYSSYNNNGKLYYENIVLRDKKTDRDFIINDATKKFIEKFSTPKNLAEIKQEIAHEANTSVSTIEKVIQPFFSYMKFRKFIVPENFTQQKQKEKQFFEVNEIHDEFKIIKSIDSNNDVDIYKAINLQSKGIVAIKFLKESSKKAIAELQREFDFLRCLNNTNVSPKAHSIVIKDKYAYFVQDYIDSLSLPEYIERKKLSLKNILIIISEILNAFSIIHSKDIVHGDVHSSNILITRTNRIKIIDFGLAVNAELDKHEIINFGGAYFYMPPERIKKTTHKKFSKRPDFFSDVYQLGIIFFKLLYNAYPFDGLTWEELSAEIKEKRVVFSETSYHNFNVPQWLKDIIEKCLAKTSSDRFNNAGQIYSAFKKN